MAVLLFVTLYLLGFLPPLFTSRWRSLGLCLAVTMLIFALFALFVLVPSSGKGAGFAAVGFGIMLLVVAIGALSGHIARAVTLSMRWPNRARPAIITIIVAPFIAPAALFTALSISDCYKQKRSAEMYAALPTADTLPSIAACEPFRKTGPLLSAILIPHRRGSLGMPERETRLVYPVAYREAGKPLYPKEEVRHDWMDFAMRLEDFQPVADNKDTSIPFTDRVPTVRFRFSPAHPLDRDLAIRLDWKAYRARPDEPLKIETAASAYPGLLEVTAPTPKPGSADYARHELRYVGRTGERISEFLLCNEDGRVPLPHCQFRLDQDGIPIQGSFRKTELPRWTAIRDHLRDFAACSVEAGKGQR